MTETYNNSILKATHRLAYYEAIGASLFPIPAGQKNPTGIVASFAKDCSIDPEQWLRLEQENPNCNFGVVAGPSGLVVIDIDTKDGVEAAWQQWHELCQAWGCETFTPQVQSPSGGWHAYFLVTAGVDARALRQPDAIKGRINIRAGNGYVVAAGSYYDGKDKGVAGGVYTLLHDAPPHPAPDALIKHCTRATGPASTVNSSVVGRYNKEDVAALVSWLNNKAVLDDYEDWYQLGMALKVEFGDAGLELWQQISWAEVTDEHLMQKWESFASEYQPGHKTLNTFLARAHTLGWTGSVRKSDAGISKMFDGVPVVQLAESPPIAPGTILPKHASELLQSTAIPPKLIVTDAEFVANREPPSYLLDGIYRRGYLYTHTAPTGGGKTAEAMLLAECVGLGRPFAGREVEQGRVLYFAAENYVDVQDRWVAQAQHHSFEIGKTNVHFVFRNCRMSEIGEQIAEEAKAHDDWALIVVDTSQATFEGQDGNSDVQQVEHARRMRWLTGLPGKPTVIILAHPIKRPSGPADLLPKGGGGLLNEVDGNTTSWKRPDGLCEFHWCGKIRGPEFEPLLFEMRTVTADKNKDAKGRDMPTVLAVPTSEEVAEAKAAQVERDGSLLLRAIDKQPGSSYADLALDLCWTYGKDKKPHKQRVLRALEGLGNKLVERVRGKLRLTPKGQKELNALDSGRAVTAIVSPPPPLPHPPEKP